MIKTLLDKLKHKKKTNRGYPPRVSHSVAYHEYYLSVTGQCEQS